MQTCKVVVRVARTAFDGIYAVPVRSASHVHRVRVAIVSLTRIISFRMAVHAPRIVEHRHDGFEGSGPIVAFCAPRSRKQQNKQETNRQKVYGCSNDHASVKHFAGNFHSACANAAFTRSGVNGKSRTRAPVASKIALPIAAGVTVMAVSPAPVAGTLGGVTNILSIVGIS